MLRFPNFDFRSISIRFLAQNDDFDSILVMPTLNHSRQNSVTTDARRSSSKPLQNRPAFANWCELAPYVSADNSLPVTSDQSPTHLAFAEVKVTGDNHVPTVDKFIADHPSATFLETWCAALTEAVITGWFLCQFCKLGRMRWTANSHGGKHFGWQMDCVL